MSRFVRYGVFPTFDHMQKLHFHRNIKIGIKVLMSRLVSINRSLLKNSTAKSDILVGLEPVNAFSL